MESQYGEHPRTYRQGYHGGIWQVDPVGFEQTRNNPKLEGAYQKIKENFGVDYNSLKYEDLRKPVYSGLAARLYLLDRVGDKEPATVVDRAKAWKVHYNTKAGKGTVPMYVRKVRSSIFEEEKAKVNTR